MYSLNVRIFTRFHRKGSQLIIRVCQGNFVSKGSKSRYVTILDRVDPEMYAGICDFSQET